MNSREGTISSARSFSELNYKSPFPEKLSFYSKVGVVYDKKSKRNLSLIDGNIGVK